MRHYLPRARLRSGLRNQMPPQRVLPEREETVKRLCIFYRSAEQWERKRVEWIVCKECQKRILGGELCHMLFKAAADYKLANFRPIER